LKYDEALVSETLGWPTLTSHAQASKVAAYAESAKKAAKLETDVETAQRRVRAEASLQLPPRTVKTQSFALCDIAEVSFTFWGGGGGAGRGLVVMTKGLWSL
jgi:hypothetical protein